MSYILPELVLSGLDWIKSRGCRLLSVQNTEPMVEIILDGRPIFDTKDGHSKENILQFDAKVVTIPPGANNGSMLAPSPSKIGIGLAFEGESNMVDTVYEARVLVVREEDGYFFREGTCRIEEDKWEKLTKETKTIKLC